MKKTLFLIILIIFGLLIINSRCSSWDATMIIRNENSNPITCILASQTNDSFACSFADRNLLKADITTGNEYVKNLSGNHETDYLYSIFSGSIHLGSFTITDGGTYRLVYNSDGTVTKTWPHGDRTYTP